MSTLPPNFDATASPRPHTSGLPPNFFLINKPVNWTSFDVVGYIRKIARAKTGIKRIKVGHAGTLDPFATGLLIVGVGRDATRTIDQFKNLPKTYRATIFLGATSTTGDPTGVVTRTQEHENIKTLEQIDATLKSFLGKQTQIPPMHSAKSIDGVRLYKLARQGKVVDRQPNDIEIFSLSLISYQYPHLTIDVSVSSGTYIRTLAEDIGAKLGCGAYCLALERTAIGPYHLSQAVAPEEVQLS